MLCKILLVFWLLRLWRIMLFHSRFLWCGFFPPSLFQEQIQELSYSAINPAIYNLTSWELKNSLKAPPLFKATPCSSSASLFFLPLHLCYCLWDSGLRAAETLVSKEVIRLTWEQIHLLGHLSHFLRFHWETGKDHWHFRSKKKTTPQKPHKPKQNPVACSGRDCNCCSLGLCQNPLL